jgi:hypothetical protein
VTVATIIRPAQPSPSPRIVSYQTAYDALGGQCDPSYTLAGGNSSFDGAETAVMGLFVAKGDTVVVSDYEGENLRSVQASNPVTRRSTGSGRPSTCWARRPRRRSA